MADEIKYLSLEGLRHFWQDKLKPEIEYDEEVIAASLVDLDDRLKSHTHTQYAPTSHTHNYSPTSHVHSNASTTVAGFMSGPDKKKLDGLSTVATTGSYNDLSNKPTIPTVYNGTLTIKQNGTNTLGTFTANQSSSTTIDFIETQPDWNETTTTSPAHIRNKPNLATVATSGSYNDLSNKPTLSTLGAAPTAHTHTSVASAGYAATAANSVTAARAIYSASAGYVSRVNLQSSNSTSYLPMVFTTAKTATTGANLFIDSVTDTTSTATGIRYNPYYNRCYCSGGFYEASDERLKNFGDDIEVDLDKLLKLSKKYFTWKDDKSNVQHIGVSAQEVQELYPEIVNVIDEDGHLSVSYDKLSVVALKGIDILNDKITSLEKRLDKLEGKLNIAQ